MASVIVLMGVAGAGKTTVGRALAAELGWRFVDADGLHPPSNVRKMSAGVPLGEADRVPWLAAVYAAIVRALDRREPAVVACSALKARYRFALRGELRGVRIVYLRVLASVLRERLRSRPAHFAGVELLESQLQALEEPEHEEDVVTLDGTLPPPELIGAMRREFGL